MSAIENLKNKQVNFPILGTVSVLTAGVVVLVGFFFLTKTGIFRSPRRTYKVKEF